MELAIRIRIEELPEAVYLATSEDLPGLVAEGRTVADTLEIARDVARRIPEASSERGEMPFLRGALEAHDFTIVVAA